MRNPIFVALLAAVALTPGLALAQDDGGQGGGRQFRQQRSIDGGDPRFQPAQPGPRGFQRPDPSFARERVPTPQVVIPPQQRGPVRDFRAERRDDVRDFRGERRDDVRDFRRDRRNFQNGITPAPQFRDQRRDFRADRRDDTRDFRADRRDDRRDFRGDFRPARPGFQTKPGFRGDFRGPQNFRGDGRFSYGYRGNWNRDWRRDNRWDWQGYRNYNRSAFRLPQYYAPYGWTYGYRRISIGFTLNRILFDQRYWINDPYFYRLPDAYYPYQWVRYYDDALLVDVETCEVVDTVYGIFY